MKSCLGLLLVLVVFVLVIGSGGLIWYLSSTSEISRKDAGSAGGGAAPPRAVPVRPQPASPARR